MKTFEVTDYTNLSSLKCCGWTDRWEKCLSSTPIKNEKKTHKIGGAHLQCVNIHYAKFEYEGMNTVGRLHKLGTPTHFRWKQCLCSTLIKSEKKNMKCAQNT